MGKGKAFIGIGMLCAVMTLCAGCGRQEKDDKVESIRIGVTVYDQYDTFVSKSVL